MHSWANIKHRDTRKERQLMEVHFISDSRLTHTHTHLKVAKVSKQTCQGMCKALNIVLLIVLSVCCPKYSKHCFCDIIFTPWNQTCRPWRLTKQDWSHLQHSIANSLISLRKIWLGEQNIETRCVKTSVLAWTFSSVDFISAALCDAFIG